MWGDQNQNLSTVGTQVEKQQVFLCFFFTIIFIFHGPRTIMLSLMTSVHGHILLEPDLYCNFILHFTAYDHQTGTLAVVFTNYFSLSTAHIILDSLMIKLLGKKLKRNHHLFIYRIRVRETVAFLTLPS
jgi:hypothetical protein